MSISSMRSKPMILVALLLAAFAINLDTTMVNVALPSLVRELHATTTQLQWVVDAYNLVFAALLLTFGSLSDRFGRKGMLLAGLTVFGAASLVGGFTTSPAQLIAARAVMGLGAAMTFPATLSLISNVFGQRREPGRIRGRRRAAGRVHRLGAADRPPDARRAAVPQHAVQRGQRRGHRRVLHVVRLHLPDHPVLPVRQGLRAAVHRRAPAAGGAVGRHRLGGRDTAGGAGGHQARRHRRARRHGGLLRLGGRDYRRDPRL